MSRRLATAAAGLLLSSTQLSPAAGCGTGGWYDVYSGDKCWNEGDGFGIKCEQKWTGDTCGARLQKGGNIGVGSLSMSIKAAPGNGVITSFYLSNNGGMYAPGTSWNEIDFEIMGLQAHPDGSRIWTNFFTGSGEEHHGYQSVPFDVSAGEHVYSFDLNSTHISWLVDGKPIRSDDITPWGDMTGAIESSSLQGYLSVWGKANGDDPLNACQEFMDGMGKLDDNANGFPLASNFRPVDAIPATQPPATAPPPPPPAAEPAAAAVPPPAEANPLPAAEEMYQAPPAVDPAAVAYQQDPAAVAYQPPPQGMPLQLGPPVSVGYTDYNMVPGAIPGNLAPFGQPQAKFEVPVPFEGKRVPVVAEPMSAGLVWGMAVTLILLSAFSSYRVARQRSSQISYPFQAQIDHEPHNAGRVELLRMDE